MNWESHSRFPTQKRVPHADQLLVAAAHGKLDVVQRLVEQDDALVDARSEYGLTALMQAISLGHIPVAKWLLEKGADANATGVDGKTALHTCAFEDAVEEAELLLSYGAEVNKQARNGQSPLHVAAFEEQKDMVCFLLKHGADMNLIDEDGRRVCGC